MESANQPTPQTQSDNSALHNRDLQCLVILKRLKSLKYTLDVLSNESRKDILNTNPNLRAKFPVTSFWSCHAHATCVECDICCSCVLKMYVEIHMLSERDYVGDNYVAVSNILNTLMRKLAIQNEIQKRRKEAEAKKQKIDEQKYISDRKIETVTSEYSQETINWPDDLGDLVNKWGSYPENQNNNSFFKTITNTEMDQLKRTALEPILPQQHQQPVTHNNQVLRGWSIHRPSPMVARPLISQINNRAILNRTVVPRPILTHPVSTAGRPLMSHIVAGRHHIMSQFVTGRPIISRVISGHSLMGNTVTAQSLMNHSSIAGRNIIQGIQNNSTANSSQVLQNHNLSRQLNHNVTFFSYNSTLQSRNEHQIITKKIVDE